MIAFPVLVNTTVACFDDPLPDQAGLALQADVIQFTGRGSDRSVTVPSPLEITRPDAQNTALHMFVGVFDKSGRDLTYDLQTQLIWVSTNPAVIRPEPIWCSGSSSCLANPAGSAFFYVGRNGSTKITVSVGHVSTSLDVIVSIPDNPKG